ncbi:MAG: hypothetical protein CK424_06755 [Legionella sp.]|nr:MAG: hypothetical protein CK424_06755 [Legionella sp.]
MEEVDGDREVNCHEKRRKVVTMSRVKELEKGFVSLKEDQRASRPRRFNCLKNSVKSSWVLA